jgi:hypothetical protein
MGFVRLMTGVVVPVATLTWFAVPVTLVTPPAGQVDPLAQVRVAPLSMVSVPPLVT